MGADLQRLRQGFLLTRKLYQAELPRDRQDSPNDPKIKIANRINYILSAARNPGPRRRSSRFRT
jgi:hypothetical protein